MGEESNIAWTDHSFNGWWGCEKVSPGCAHCYAETFAKRTGNDIWGKDHSFRFFGVKHWSEPLKWNRDAAAAGIRKRVFTASMADVFEDRPELVEPRARLFDLIERTPNLDWLVLTKRASEMFYSLTIRAHTGGYHPPLPNAWFGVSIENDRFVDRATLLRCTPASVRFISAEPLLGPLVHRCKTCGGSGGTWSASGADPCEAHCNKGWTGLDLTGIDWLIIGGESGPNHRPMDPQWVRDLIAKAREAGTAVFFKQMGGLRPGGPIPDEFNIREYPR